MYRGHIIKVFGITIVVFTFTLGMLFMSGDIQSYHYKVEIQRCQNQDKIIKEFDTRGKKIYISAYREAVPVLYVGREKIMDVCDYKILEQKEIE